MALSKKIKKSLPDYFLLPSKLERFEREMTR